MGISTAVMGTCASSSSSSSSSRSYYVHESVIYELRLRNEVWIVGLSDAFGEWTPLTERSCLCSTFYDSTNEKELDQDGECHVGRSASVVLYPHKKTLPDGFRFSVDPEILFDGNRMDVYLGDRGVIFLDGTVYSLKRVMLHTLPVEIYSEVQNPAIVPVIKTLYIFTQRFPHRTEQMKHVGKITVVLLRNRTEQFVNQPLSVPNGLHDETDLTVVQFSENGEGVLLHALHEVGGLFRLLNNKYAQGLTWALAYDLYEELLAVEEVMQERRKKEVVDLIYQLQKTVAQGKGYESIAYFIESYDPHKSGEGYYIYTFVSAYFWKQINNKLRHQNLPDLYQLIDFIHLSGAEGRHDLEKLVGAYQRLSPEGAIFFETVVNNYFRKSSLYLLLANARQNQI